MKRQLHKIIILLLGFIITFYSLGFTESSIATLKIPLVYPQTSNAPKRPLQKLGKPPILKGEVLVEAVGIEPEQLEKATFYIEYYLDNDLLYSTEDKPKPASLGFTLDTQAYPNGEYQLVINLWDKDGPSAIGISKLIIQNLKAEE